MIGHSFTSFIAMAANTLGQEKTPFPIKIKSYILEDIRMFSSNLGTWMKNSISTMGIR